MDNITSDMRRVSFNKIMTRLNNESLNTHEKGEKFERLMKDALPLLKPSGTEIKKVWLWKEWPHASERQDTGIDLVTELKNGSYRAIQCKFHESSVMYDSLATFINKSVGTHIGKDGRKIKFDSLMVVTTSNSISRHSESALDRMRRDGVEIFVVNKNELAMADIDWGDLAKQRPKASLSKKTLRTHQTEAIKKVTGAFANGTTKGQMIMACGTGKTFVSLKIVEKMFGQNGAKNGAPANILFCVPSIALLSQALRDYSNDMELNSQYFAVCSDNTAGDKTSDSGDRVSDLAFAPTTHPKRLANGMTRKTNARLNVVFSTYHSLDVIKLAQKKHGAPDFDLIICDEAHRTTGHEVETGDVNLNAGVERISEFGKVHFDKHVKGKKRLYMTATPRVYGSKLTETAMKKGIKTFGMDDKDVFGEVIFRYNFGRAVSEGILSDYCVHILGIKGQHVIDRHRQLQNDNVEIEVPDVAKMVGIRQIISGPNAFGKEYPSLKRLLFFARTINRSQHLITEYFPKVADQISDGTGVNSLNIKMTHVDGTMSATKRNEHISWLREDESDNETRILSNVRCLSEGVDIPALDGVVYYDPRRSIVDIVQSLGRIMRKDPLGRKEYGHIIIPVCMPDDHKPEEFLSKNKAYSDAWKVLQALRSHDDRVEEEINLMDLNNRLPERFKPVISRRLTSEEIDINTPESLSNLQLELLTPSEEWIKTIKPIWVEKVGSRQFLKMWAKDVASMAVNLVSQIMEILKKPDDYPKFVKVFNEFRAGLKTIIGDAITEENAAEMLAQHILTKPIFQVLFDGYELSAENAISKEIDRVERVLLQVGISHNEEELRPFYEDVALRVKGVDNLSGRRTVLENIYAEFFKEAFPTTAESSGIVYTPQEAVDFILHGANAVLHKHLNKNIANKDVHVLDPFTGCGQFIVRLLDSGIIKKGEALKWKYENEIHANELLLLPFYIAMVNIEQAYHEKSGNEKLVPFQKGILADTFALDEKNAKGAHQLEDFFNRENKKAEEQTKQNIEVIVSNPPYFASGGGGVGVSVAQPGT